MYPVGRKKSIFGQKNQFGLKQEKNDTSHMHVLNA
jgi:hypothetical protein